MPGTNKIKVAISGVGNCASALVQGVEFYRDQDGTAVEGVMRPSIGGYRCGDIEFVAAFDIDQRKVGRPLEEAIFAKPNCTRVFQSALPVSNVIVQMGPILDGVAAHMADYPDDDAFRPVDLEPTDIATALRASGAEVLLCYLPVGSEQAVKHYARACLDARVAMINCVPVFLASDPHWAEQFQIAGVPIVGDDIKSQVGATIVHRALVRLFSDRGVGVDRTYQLNTGGNTDFLNMLERSRLKAKKVSKTDSVQSQLDQPLDPLDIHIGPSDYVPWQRDNKVCFIRVEGRGFGGAPIELEMRLSVEDSPNSAGVVIDAIRCVRLALERGQAGPLLGPSAYYMKRPPCQLRDSLALEACDAFIEGRSFAFPTDAGPQIAERRYLAADI
jgi:myo-inositol-1-phosphate synthase